MPPGSQRSNASQVGISAQDKYRRVPSDRPTPSTDHQLAGEGSMGRSGRINNTVVQYRRYVQQRTPARRTDVSRKIFADLWELAQSGDSARGDNIRSSRRETSQS